MNRLLVQWGVSQHSAEFDKETEEVNGTVDLQKKTRYAKIVMFSNLIVEYNNWMDSIGYLKTTQVSPFCKVKLEAN